MKELYGLFRKHTGAEPENAVALTGSGSNRSYFRLHGGGTSLMGVTGTDVKENNAFITLAAHFRSQGLPVPEVLAVSEDGISYLQEDLGDLLLADLVAAAHKNGGIEEGGQLEALLCRTTGLLPKIQFEGASGLDFSVCYPQPSFDRRMVMFDLNYFKYCFLKPSGLEFNEVRLQDEFERLADDLLGGPEIQEYSGNTFMYRDFQSRNVMLHDDQPYFIDFQGGRKGPIYYDLASFVWQPRAPFSNRLRNSLTDAYVQALSEYMPVNREEFDSKLGLFILFRLLQLLGAYGFRGLVENKAAFITAIPLAMNMLREQIAVRNWPYPYLMELLAGLTELPKFQMFDTSDGKLHVRVCSFSFMKGLPVDLSGNGGGYIFDCRYIHNPGRYEPYKKLTGRDEPVIRFLEDDGEVFRFLEHVYGVVDPHVETYSRRGFNSLMVSFGCTGGQHRSVYCAESLARHLREKYPDIIVTLSHREQNI
jgi:aminoglycoside/choline kinase family phosphotransferase